MRKDVANIHVIKSDTDSAPDGAEWRGEYIQWGPFQKKVFVETRELSELKPRVDPMNGGALYKRGAGGVVLNAIHTERVATGVEEREFLLDDMGNGMVTKVFSFRPDPAEAAMKDKAARRQKNLDALLDAAEEAGGIDALLNGAADEDDAPADDAAGEPAPPAPAGRERK